MICKETRRAEFKLHAKSVVHVFAVLYAQPEQNTFEQTSFGFDMKSYLPKHTIIGIAVILTLLCFLSFSRLLS